MLKVLIADDEVIICQMLKKLIHWEEKGLRVEAVASNGLEAYELMKKIRPDIIITDIRMPGLDGLALVQKGIEISLDADFIIMSGYKNFEYAHTALNLGVKHYLLKPIDEKELNDTLDQILEARHIARQAQQEKEEARELAKNGKRKMRQHFLNSIIESSVSASGAGAVGMDDCDFDNGCFITFFTKIDSEAPTSDMASLLEMINYQIEKNMALPDWEFINAYVKSGVITVVNYPVGMQQKVMETISDVLMHCQKELNKFDKYHVTIGVGSQKNMICDIQNAIREAVLAVKCRLKKGVDGVIFWDTLHYKSISVDDIFTEKYRVVMKNQIEVLDAKGFVDVAIAMYDQVRRQLNYSPAALYDLLDRMTELILNVWTSNQVEASTLADLRLRLDMVMDCNYIENMLLYTYDETVVRFFERVKDEKKNSSQFPIRMAKQYINAHYSHAITLEDVAEAIGLSPAYLSTLFKKEIGINFSDYLTSCRMEAAKTLLKEKSGTINEIAEAVGYVDPKYFSKTFNKVVGLKPSEYRKLYR